MPASAPPRIYTSLHTLSLRYALPIFELRVLGELVFPAVAVRQQLLLVVEQRLAGLGGEFEVRPFHDGVHRAGLLAEAAVDALRHVDVVARGAPAAVAARLGLDDDALRRADRLAKLAGDRKSTRLNSSH